MQIEDVLKSLDIQPENPGTYSGSQGHAGGYPIISRSPVDGKSIAQVTTTTAEEYEQVVSTATAAFHHWRTVPAPVRGDMVRQFGDALRDKKEALGYLVSYEMGKSYQEGLGEVQEMIDICDFALGQSRMLYGFTMHSERPSHRMYEQWHPLGAVGIISAFNFPVAVWCWNTALAWICGDVTIWKPSEKVPLCGLACQKLITKILLTNELPTAISNLINGGVEVGQWLSSDKRLPLISATGSIPMGRKVGATVAQRLGKSILELGGNNAIIITENADLDATLVGAVFGAVGTAGQRCTSTRRLIVHQSKYNEVREKLKAAYQQIRIGNPLDETNHMGPLIDEQAVAQYEKAISKIQEEGGEFLVEGGVLTGTEYASGCYVKPCIAEVKPHFKMVQTETFAPILYLMAYDSIEQAIQIQNDVPQGLSSAIMTTNMRESELFLSAAGSDCGIANVNNGTSGAEIGGAFGGEKETGGGRESGSDAWKAYMRRQTTTINYSREVPLAQGISFDL